MTRSRSNQNAPSTFGLPGHEVYNRPNFPGLVAISEALKRDFLASFPWLSSGQILVARDAAAPAADVDTPRRPGPIRVDYSGHLYPGKGMEIISAVAPMLPDIEFHVAGGTDRDITQWKKLCAANVCFHGHVGQEMLAKLYSSFDIAVAPAQSIVHTDDRTVDIARWTSPLTIFEYMSHGLPIVVFDLPFLREILEDNTTALIVPSADVSASAGALRRLSGDAVLRAKLGAAVKAQFLAQHTLETRVRTILARFADEAETYMVVSPDGIEPSTL